MLIFGKKNRKRIRKAGGKSRLTFAVYNYKRAKRL
jgi:hypothetical protein